MKTATFLKGLSSFKGYAWLYQLSEPVVYDGNLEANHVIVTVIFSGPFSLSKETIIFPANEEGGWLHWGKLHGSFQGDDHGEKGLHEQALNRAGYEVAAGPSNAP